MNNIKITDIRSQEKGGLYSIFTQEGFAFSLTPKGIFESGVSIGREYTEKEFKNLTEYAENEKAYRYAVHLLGYRDYSENELKNKLKLKGYKGDKAVSRLVEQGYVNDLKYAGALIEKYKSKYGKRRIEDELNRHMIKKETYQALLNDDNSDMSEKIYQRLKERMKNLPFEDRRDRDKAYQYFVRQGYGYDEISRAFRMYNENIENFEDL